MPARPISVTDARRRAIELLRALERERAAVLALFPDLISFSRRHGQVGPHKRARDRPPRVPAIERRRPGQGPSRPSGQWRRPH
jgi:hypothetical protein